MDEMKLYGFPYYEENGSVYIDAPVSCHECLETGKGKAGHFQCGSVPEDLRKAYDRGLIDAVYDGTWKWVVLE